MQLIARPNESLAIIMIDQKEYAIIEYVESFNNLDIDNIANWVNETCYNDDHLCDTYEPCRLKYWDFKLEEQTK